MLARPLPLTRLAHPLSTRSCSSLLTSAPRFPIPISIPTHSARVTTSPSASPSLIIVPRVHSRAMHAPSQSESASKLQPIFSADQPENLPGRVDALVHWRLSPSRKGLTRTFTFTSFAKAWSFMSRVADECKVQRHHPEWSNLYNRVTVEWTTHRPEGLSVKDVDMAEFCDGVASEIGLKE